MKLSLPSLAIPVGVYNVMAVITLVTPSLFGSAYDATTRTLFNLPMLSHDTALALTFGHIILLVGLVSLFFELISSTRSNNQALFGDALTLILFVVCLIEFLLLPPFATATFFLLTVMVLMDSMAGFIVSAVSARKDISLGG